MFVLNYDPMHYTLDVAHFEREMRYLIEKGTGMGKTVILARPFCQHRTDLTSRCAIGRRGARACMGLPTWVWHWHWR